MDCKILFFFFLINYFSEALPTVEYTDKSSSHEDEHLYTQLKEGVQKIDFSSKPISSYEVTEIVIDIPNNQSIGPIHTNFTLQRPLNIATTVNIPVTENNQVKDGDEDEKKCITNLNHKDMSDINAEDLDSDKVPLSKIKDYFYGFKKGIVSGFNSIIHRNRNKESVDDDEETGELSIIDKLHKKGTDVVHKVRSALFGEKFDDVFGSR